MPLGHMPGATASKAEDELMDRMLDAAFNKGFDGIIVVSGNVETGKITIKQTS